jgi:DNA (cytosine-5)-methyltransferase 1
MVTRLQGWRDEWGWRFTGLKTARYRQIGNAFPPPVAEAVGTAIRRALEHADPAGPADPSGSAGPGGAAGSAGSARPAGSAPSAGQAAHVHDPVFRVLRSRDDFLTAGQIADLAATAARAARARGVPAAARGAGPGPSARLSPAAVLERLRHLSQDFELEIADSRDGPAYRLGRFRAFLGQPDHARHQRFAAARATIS